MFCPNCGTELKNDAKFCNKCGKRLDAPEASESAATKEKKSKTGLIIGILVLVLFLLLAGIGCGIFLYMQKMQDSDKPAGVQQERSAEEKEKTEENSEETEEATEPETTLEQPTTAAATTMAPTTAALQPLTAVVNYASNVSLAGMVRAVPLQSTAYESSHLVQQGTTINNSAWSAFDGQASTSWQEGVAGNGIGEYLGISFDREYDVQVVTLQVGNHRSDDWYVKNNTPRTLTITLGEEILQVTLPKEKTQFAIQLSRPVKTGSIRLEVDDVYPGTAYTDTIIAEVGVYGN